MSTIRKFEDLQAWKDAIALADAVYAETRKPAFAKDFGLVDQMRRAAVSISSNIAEGFERESNQEFVRFLSIAKGSAGELRSQLHVAKHAGYIGDERFADLYAVLSETGRRLAHFISYLQNDIKSRKPPNKTARTPLTSPKATSNVRAAGFERGRSPLGTPAQPA